MGGVEEDASDGEVLEAEPDGLEERDVILTLPPGMHTSNDGAQLAFKVVEPQHSLVDGDHDIPRVLLHRRKALTSSPD